MNTQATVFLVLMILGILMLSRKWAVLPLLIGACYMTRAQGIEVGSAYLTVVRILIFVGFARVVVRRELIRNRFGFIDKAMLAWTAAALFSSIFHSDQGAAFEFRGSLVLECGGIYLLCRCLCRDVTELRVVIIALAVLVIPLAVEMIGERLTHKNMFSFFGGVPEDVKIRDGKFRAQGPFAHPILAGTVGAVCLPFFVGIWREFRLFSVGGIVACVVIVFASNSSGPLMSMMLSMGALLAWRWRHLTRQMRIAAVGLYVLLDLVMQQPGYYILAKIDLTGSSTGWHRAKLIESSIKHLEEWWVGGTDYTRHWMPTGVSWSENHTDITNYYIKMGVIGGIPLMASLIVAMSGGFVNVGRFLRAFPNNSSGDAFLVWSVGAALFAHATTCVSVSYFDQSSMFLYFTLGVLGTLGGTASGATFGSTGFDSTLVYQEKAG